MISVNNLSVSHGARTLFQDATFILNKGSRYGIVGANGSGKSTLLRVISGQDEATTGSVTIQKTARVGVLKQDHFELDHVPIIHVVMMGIPELWEAMEEREKMLKAAETDPEAFDVDRFGELEDAMMRFDGYGLEARAATILEGLNIPANVHFEPLSVLSGGYKLRVLLAQTLAAEPDVLLLDEPTNHLDILSIAWLENFLANYSGCAAVVSHDQAFLNAVCTHIIDVDYELATLYTGNYDKFELAKHDDRERKEREIAKQEAEIADRKKFVERFRAKATKARQAQSKLKQIEKIDVEKLPQSSRRYPYFNFTAQRDTGKKVVDFENIDKSYDDKVVLNGVTAGIRKGDRVAVIGPNGIGKSTLLKVLVDEVAADSGKVDWGHGTEVGYFSQDQENVKSHPSTTIHDWLWSHCPEQPTGFVRGKLAEVLFGKDDVDKKISALSGGEVARLAFAKLIVTRPTVLVLDEPTNHLDLEGIESLAVGLLNYPNTILFVSHDRWFVSEIATRVLELRHDGMEDYPGGYDEFLRKTGADDRLER